MTITYLPRGIRNNNPGNIRHGDKWKGLSQEQTDPSFCQFETPEYGLRALMKVLLTYYWKRNLDTVRKIITRWAPPTENNTESYIKAVAAGININPDDVLRVETTSLLITLAQEIVKHENGLPPGPPWKDPYWYDLEVYVRAAKMAKGLDINKETTK